MDLSGVRLRLAFALPLCLAWACHADRAAAPDNKPPTSPPAGQGMLADSGGRYRVDTRAGLVFQVNKGNGDIVSLQYRGTELQDQAKFSHIASGLGTATVTATASGDTVVTVACATPTLTHYYVARSGTSAIFMATYITAEPAVGELRYIARLDRSRLPNGNPKADVEGLTAIEGSDVFGLPNGESRSKFFGNPRAIDNLVHGVSGPGVAVWMVMGNRESSSGGPFFRDIDNQGSAQQELYNYMNSNHTQTEPYRMGLHGPYALVVTSGDPPANVDMSWLATFGLAGWTAQRGRVTGSVSGVPGGVPVVVGWANTRAQYWARVNADGTFASPPMIPGTYTQTLYKRELALSTASVVVGTTTVTQNLAFAEPDRPAVFRIGEFDGTPDGFRNAELQPDMHPSDVRMPPWGPLTYTVGSSAPADFPMAQFKDVNNATTIRFTLQPGEVQAHTFRIAITLAFAGGRPVITVNPGTLQAWTGPIPPISTQPDSRGVTRGTYRGNNTEFTFEVPASAFVPGSNTIVISVASGSSGTRFLSPSVVYDAVQLDR